MFLSRIANTVPERGDLARINGASTSLACLSRSIGPIITGRLYAVGLNAGYVGIPFWLLGGVSSFAFLQSATLKDHA